MNEATQATQTFGWEW